MNIRGIHKQTLKSKPKETRNIGFPEKIWRVQFHPEGKGTGTMSDTSEFIIIIIIKVEGVHSFTYLESAVNNENKMRTHFHTRLMTAHIAHIKLSGRSKFLPRNIRLKPYKTLIRPILTYRPETWTKNS
jgi:hypothetical protein